MRGYLDRRKLFISVTHTHTAPVVELGNFIIPEGVMTIEEYRRLFADRVAGAVAEARAALRPASVSWGLGYAKLARNRRAAYLDGRSRMYGPTGAADFRGPEGPEHDGIASLFFFDEAGKTLAVAADVWCPSQEAEAESRISADFWHPARMLLKDRLGPGVVILPWCGPAGDQSPHRRMAAAAEDRMVALRGSKSWVDELGRRIAGAVIETHDLVKADLRRDAPLVHRVEILRLPGWKMGDAEIARIRAERDALAEDLRLHPEKAAELARPVSWRSQTIERHEKVRSSPDGCYPTEVHVLRIGDAAVCTNQFELFTEYGLRILARSRAHLTIPVGLTGAAFYLPTEEAVRGGDYGAIPESCAVGPEGGRVLVDRTIDIIESLFPEAK